MSRNLVDDFMAEHEKRKKETILKLGRSSSEAELYCPYCAHEQTDIWDGFDLQPNDEDREDQCQKCERYFFYSVTLSFSSRQGK